MNPECSEKKNRALKGDGFHSNDLERKQRPKRQGANRPPLLQRADESPPDPRQQCNRGEYVIEIQKRQESPGKLVRRGAYERGLRVNPQASLQEIQARAGQQRMDDEVQFESVIEGEQHVKKVGGVERHVVRVRQHRLPKTEKWIP